MWYHDIKHALLFLQVNEHDVTNVTHEEVTSLLQNSGVRVVLQIIKTHLRHCYSITLPSPYINIIF